MPATALTATVPAVKTGTVLAASPGVAADNVNGNTIPNNGSTLLLVNNTAGSSATVAVAFAATVDGQAVTPVTLTVPANTIHIYRLGDPKLYGSRVTVTASAATVKLLALQ